MKEADMFNKIVALNEIDDEFECWLNVFTDVVNESPLGPSAKELKIQFCGNYLGRLKLLNSDVIGAYLEKIIEARAT